MYGFDVNLLSSFAPMMVVGITVLVVMLAIATKRSHFWSATLSVMGLNTALILLLLQVFGVWKVAPLNNMLFLMDNFAYFNMGVILISSLACCTLAYGYFGTLK